MLKSKIRVPKKNILKPKDVLLVVRKRQLDGHDRNLTFEERGCLHDYHRLLPEQKRKFDILIEMEAEKIRDREQRRQNRLRGRRQNRSPTPIKCERNLDRSRSPIINRSGGEPVIDVEAEGFHARANFERETTPTSITNDSVINYEYDDPNTYDVTENNIVIKNNNTSRAANPFATDLTSKLTPLAETLQESQPFIMGALKNIGNSCYMNAVLYTLRLTPKLLHEVHHLFVNLLTLCTDMIELNDDFSENACCKRVSNQILFNDRLPEGIELSETIKEVIIEWHEIFMKLTIAEQKENFEPIKTNDLQKAIFAENTTFVPFTQQDSHEFLMCVLNCLRDCSDTFLKSIENHPQMYQKIEDPATNLSFNFFRENFMGQRLSTMCCFNCETKTSREEEMIDLFVPLPAKSNIDANFIQNSCSTRERIEEKVFCTECYRYTESMQIITFPRLPRILIIHLSRFDNQMNKINTVTPPPLQLDCFCVECIGNVEGKREHEYHLYSIIVHLGETLRSGHYITYTKALNGVQNRPHECDSTSCCCLTLNRNDKKIDDLWYICDDDKITTVPEHEFVEMVHQEASRKTPYILFYARSDLVAGK